MPASYRKSSIKDMASLDEEISRLKHKCKEIEGRFDENIDQLRDNYPIMAFNSIIGNRLKAFPIVGDIASVALSNEKVQNFLQALIDKIFNKSSGFLEKLGAKVFSSKSSKSE